MYHFISFNLFEKNHPLHFLTRSYESHLLFLQWFHLGEFTLGQRGSSWKHHNAPLSFTAHTVWLAGSESQLSLYVTLLMFSPPLLQELQETDLSEFLQIHRHQWECNSLAGDALGQRLQMPEVTSTERRLGTKSIASAERERHRQK